MTQFYTYMWLREDGTPYYVGKGSEDRAFIKDNHRHFPPATECIIVQEFESEEDAFFSEKFLIAAYGRTDQGTGCLRNSTDGGEGASGNIMSEESKKRISAATKGNKNPFFGKRHTPKSLAKMKLVHTLISEETRNKMRASARGNSSHLGHKHSVKTAEFLRNLRKGTKLTPAERQYISDRMWQRKVIQIL